MSNYAQTQAPGTSALPPQQWQIRPLLGAPALPPQQWQIRPLPGAPALPPQQRQIRPSPGPGWPNGPPAEAEPKPLKALDLSLLDRGVDACTDFYRFACGGWMARNPIPPDQAVWGRFSELSENNQIIERKILEKAAGRQTKPGSNEQKIGDYYASCMDEAAIEKKGLEPLKPELERIAKLQSKAELPAYMAHAHSQGSNAFSISARSLISRMRRWRSPKPISPGSACRTAATIPHRRRVGRAAQPLPPAHPAHVRAGGRQSGGGRREVQGRAGRRTAWPRLPWIASTPPRSRPAVSPDDRGGLAKLSPLFDWKRYFVSTGAPKFDRLNVTVPDFIKGLNEVFAKRSWTT